MNLPAGQIKIAEMTMAELYAPTGFLNEQGREVSMFDLITLDEAINHGSQQVYIDRNGQVSEEGNRINSELTRSNRERTIQNPGAYIVALVSSRPPIGQ